MKKSIIAAVLLIASTGVLSTSCTKQKSTSPTAATIERSTTANKKDVGTAD